MISPSLVWMLFGGLIVLFLLQQKQYRKNLLTLSILGFGFGWRGFSLSSFVIYPTEFFIWVGFFIYLMDGIIRKSNQNHSKMKFFEVALAILAIIGGVTASTYGRSWLQILFPLKSFLVFIPMLVLFRDWIRYKADIKFYAKMLVIVGLFISVMGLIERYVPQFTSWLPSFQLGALETRYNFELGSRIELAGFSFWGTPVVSTLLILFAGLAAIVPWRNSGLQKFVGLFAFPILVLAIIAAGYRSSWLGLAVIILSMFLLNRPQILLSIFWIVPGVVILFSSAYLDRLKTIFLIFSASSQDPTVFRRSTALQIGFQTIKTHPVFGTGWEAPTTFNDWANLGVAMGLPGLLVFAIGYGWLLLSLIRFARNTQNREDRLLYLAFVTALAGYAISMVSGAMSQVFPIMTGFWFVFCLGYRLVEISSQEEPVNGEVDSIVAHV